MIARLGRPGMTFHRNSEAGTDCPSNGGSASTVLSSLDGLAGMIRKVREELRVSKAERDLLDVVVPPNDAGPLSQQELDDWICGTSGNDQATRSD